MAKRQDTELLNIDEDILPFDPSQPEKALLVAIILNAANDLLSTGREADVAKSYFKNDDEEYIFSFKCICNHLDVDYRDIRRKVFKNNNKSKYI